MEVSNYISNTLVHECNMAILKFGDDGILYFESKPVDRNIENAKELTCLLTKILEGHRAYVLVDATYSKAMTKEARDYLFKKLPDYYKAVAVSSRTVLGAFVANIFIKINPPGYPIKIFTSQLDAKRWLMQQMKLVA